MANTDNFVALVASESETGGFAVYFHGTSERLLSTVGHTVSLV